MSKKQATAAEKRYMARVAEIGCLNDHRPAEIHHTGTYAGGGRDNMKVIPLCHECHRTGGYGVAIHAGKKEWERLHGSEEEMLERVRQILQAERND